MTPRDPDEVDQTLLPDAPAKAPTAPGAPVTETPGPFDATMDRPVSAPGVAVDPGATLTGAPHVGTVSVPVQAPAREKEARSDATVGGVEPTLLPTPAPTAAAAHDVTLDVAPGTVIGGTEATGIGADPAATLPSPTARPGGGAAAGSVTGPMSSQSGPGGLPGLSPSATGTMVGRFALRGLHASGGLGEVFTARDTELNREVAVKRIKSQYADDPGSRSRFLSEATLTARLDHPGVVPVFGLVNDVRGRPCYAMRFIRGETLKDEIDRYYGNQKPDDKGQKTDKSGAAAEGSAPGSAPAPEVTAAGVPRSVAFRQLLARFIATCQAIAYAHTKNIIHRDIKPANIMVGSFGETLVVDWGLAKSLDDGPDFDRMVRTAAEAGFRHDPDATDLPSHMTHAGTAVGTPAYMAPEQAAGEIHNVGPRADVYALGATLFVILTGRAPVGGKNTAEVLDRVRRGTYEPAAVVNPECPKPLDAVARKAMALRPDDRYATALELAADVERWLSDEPVSCYRDPLFARAARWARRHPTRVASGVSILLASMVAAIAIAVVYQQGEKQTRAEQLKTAAERDRVVDQEKKTAAALLEAQRQRDNVIAQEKKTEEQRARAVELGKVATGRYDRAVGAYNVLIANIDSRLANHIGMENLRKSLLEGATEGLNQLIAGGREGQYADRTLVSAYRQMGDVYQRLGDTAGAQKNLALAVEQARRVKSEVEKAPITGTTAAEQRAADRDLGRSLDRLAGVLVQAGESDKALTAINEALELFAVLAADRSDAEAQADLAAAQKRRSAIRMERGDTRRAIDDATAALAVRKALAPQKLTANSPPADVRYQRDYAASLDAMAELRLRTGRTEDALKNAQESLALRTGLAGLFPNHPDVPREGADAHARLGEVHFERGHMTAAAGEYRAGLKQLNALVERNPESVGARADRALMYGRLGHAQIRLGEVEDALENTKLGRDDALKLRDADPKSAKAQRDLALARERYGDALLAAGRFDEGLDEYGLSAKILLPLRDGDKESARGQLELARGLERLGDGLMATKNMAGAVAPLRDSVQIRRAAVAKDPQSASARRDLAVGLYKLADAHCGTGRAAQATGYATEATDLFGALSEADPASAQARRDVALAYGKWGQVLAAGGHSTFALIVWQDSLERSKELALVDAKNTQALEDEAAAYERLASFYAAVGNTSRALTAARTAVDKWDAIGKGVDAKTKAGRRRLALAMLRCGDINTEVRDFLQAAGWYTKAADEAKSDPNDPLLTPVAQQAKDRQEYLKAVEEGLSGPRNLAKLPVPVRLEALPTIGKLSLRANDPTTAYVAVLELAKIADEPKEPADRAAVKFTMARLLAGCAAAQSGSEKIKAEYADEAVKALKTAVAAGFRNADALAEPDWDAVRKYAKDQLEEVRRELEKLNAGGK